MKKTTHSLVIMIPIFLTALSWKTLNTDWLLEQHYGYKLYYTNADTENKKEYSTFIDVGFQALQDFFKSSFKKEFNIYIHPNRSSLDSTWQKNWNMPGFTSQCWMVASGVSDRLDMLSPKTWDEQACEHSYTDEIEVRNLIAHELAHVYHGQLNISPDFSDVTGIDWFVEGLATYVSGQCDTKRIDEVKEAVLNNTIPESLDKFWTGNLRYGLSGSVVMFIDHKFGRSKLKELLGFNRKTELLNALDITEADLVGQWKVYMKNL